MQVRTERVFGAAERLAFAALSAVALLAIGAFAVWWAGLGAWQDHPVLLGAVTLALALQVGVSQTAWWLLPRMRRPVPMKPPSGWKVGVAVTFVPGVESLEMLEETLRALVAMRYPHDTWVLDEGDAPAVRVLCDRLGAHHFTRRHRPDLRTARGRFKAGTKYGNVNAWLREVGYDRYEFVVSFDPDHVPRPEYLERVLGYFEDERVGFVQAAQVYYNQDASFIARGAAEETYAYYSSLQMASYGLGYPVVTGCHNAHRVRALREVGGFAAHDADDLLITLHYRVAGWEGIYVPEVLARGLTPVDWAGYLRQQRRWARSVLDIKLRIFPRLAGALPLRTRAMSFLHGLAYLHESLVAPLSLGVLAYLLVTGRAPLLSYLVTPPFVALAAALFALELYRQRFYLDPARERGLHWRAGLLRFAKWPQALAALVEVVLRREVPYAITPKRRVGGGPHLELGAHLALGMSLAGAWGVGLVRGTVAEGWLHVATAVLVGVSLGLVASQLLPPPAPYDRSLQRRAAQRTRS